MPYPPHTFAPEALADARLRYEQTDEPNAAIAKRLGISARTFSRTVARWGWQKRRPAGRGLLLQAAPPLAPQPPAPPPALTADAEAAAAEIQASVQHTIAAIRMIVERLPRGRNVSAAERAARALATLTRTLQEVIRLRPKQTSAEPANARGPDDPDEFARILLRRLDEFKARRAAPVPDGAGAGNP